MFPICPFRDFRMTESDKTIVVVALKDYRKHALLWWENEAGPHRSYPPGDGESRASGVQERLEGVRALSVSTRLPSRRAGTTCHNHCASSHRSRPPPGRL